MIDGPVPHTGATQARQVPAELREAVRRRARAFIEAEADRRYWERLATWGRDDEAPFPSPEDLRAEVAEELEVLCRALGLWALLVPERVFPRTRPDWTDFGF